MPRTEVRLVTLSYSDDGELEDEYILFDRDVDEYNADVERVRGALRNNIGHTQFLGKALAVEACDAFDRLTKEAP